MKLLAQIVFLCLVCVAPVVAGETVLLDETYTGELVTIRTGDALVVSLPGLFSSGYQWLPVNMYHQKFLRLSDNETFPNNTGSHNIREIFVFEVVSTGTGTLIFTQARSWESTVLHSFVVHLRAE